MTQMKHEVGDGFVELVDVMGHDADVCRAARVSYGNDQTKLKGGSDEQLIRYLMRHRHTTPFEMCELKFHLKMPIFVARQWVRHRTASINEISGRYVSLDEGYFEFDELNMQSSDNKQGRSDVHVDSDLFTGQMGTVMTLSNHMYRGLINKGVSKEQARAVLPLSTFTRFYWKIDLHNLLHFLKLRLDPHAQKEIRDYAEGVAKAVQQFFPITWRAFRDYQLEAHTFSKQEMDAIKYHLTQDQIGQIVGFAGVNQTMSDRELRELEKTLKGE